MPNQVEKLASAVMGAVEATKAKMQGTTGVFTHLSREHGKVTALLLRVKRSNDPKVRAELFPTIRSELLSHEKGELVEVYPVFREHPELVDFANEHDREAQELERRLAALATTNYDDSRWANLFSELVDVVSKHVKEEETKFFPAASKTLGKEQSEAMLSRYEEVKRAAKRNLP